MTPTLAAWLHDLDPVAFRLGPATIYWYGISYVLGFALAWVLLKVAAWRGMTPVPGGAIGDVVLFGGIGGVIGGRVGYLLIYNPALLGEFTNSFPFWQALNIARGGMASHGGMVGVLLGLLLLGHLLRKRAAKEDMPQLANVPSLHLVDLAVAVVPIGLVCGRLANFVNGELLGKVVAFQGPEPPSWSVRFPQEILSRWGTSEVGPAQIRAAAEAVGMSHLELQTEAGMERFEAAYTQLMEKLRGGGPDAIGAANFMNGFLNARHPSQLYQAAVEGPLLLLALFIVWAKPRTAGVVTAWFMILYGVGRIFTEFYRLPDTGFATARPMGLSRGQWLSVALVAGGVGLLAYVIVRARKKKAAGESVPRFGGWLSPVFASAKQRNADGGGAPDGDKAE